MSSGWQDAVAGLQSQVNTINSQISSLSGQEAADASAISSLQTQVTALQAEITNLQQLVPFGDLSGHGQSVANPTSTTVLLVQGGGFAQIAVPSDGVAGKIGRLVFVGEISYDTSTRGEHSTLSAYLGDPANVSGAVVLATGNFAGPTASPSVVPYQAPVSAIIDFIWDPIAGQFYYDSGNGLSSTDGFNSLAGWNSINLNSPAILNFFIAGSFESSASGNALLMTEFKAQTK